MEYGVYLESEIVDLKPRVLEFLTTLVDKAREARDYAIAMTRKDMADLVGRDTRTVSRYLNELEEQNIIQLKGRKGRGGSTLVLFNTEKVKFKTSDKAMVTTEEIETLEEVIERKLPKKKVIPKKDNARTRRTKQQMMEARILQDNTQVNIDKLNERVLELGGIPDWDWFQRTDNPVDNYKTYLLSRLYNRYAVLFTDRNNAEEAIYQDGKVVPRVSNNYDVFPLEFYQTVRWRHIEKMRVFCEEQDIDPVVYLSSQFSRTVYMSSVRGSKNMLPYVNTLITDKSYEIYMSYVNYQKKASRTYASYNTIPPQFPADVVVSSIIGGLKRATHKTGMFELKGAIHDFVTGTGSSDVEDALLAYYRITDKKLKDNKISLESRDVIKKYIMTQSLILTGGISKVPRELILGSDITRQTMMYIDQTVEDKEQAQYMKKRTLGALVHPSMDVEEQLERGGNYLYQLSALEETPYVVNLITERNGMYMNMLEVNKALREFGFDNVPVDDFSFLDIAQIQKVIEKEILEVDTIEDIDILSITDSKDWVLTGAIVDDEDSIEDAFKSFNNEE